ncbi:MerR family transcriptional regulator [Agromyces sp. ISL-38]|uniref:MerR family transcriptional regulator n=1 Tax=Agromyces sp. ISL-38 TaxID=2819107 RepID=UPI001BEAFE59|nr:MerR family transcriptional regulator [Agromyces sp. ISL-38]MBT2498369.1 MerR family transcriptional regulator [Agromyces sp. ISL-38]
MKISEVSRRTGVTATTMKYYLRAGLVHSGERVGSNQTAYDDSHVQRVRLVRALIETGGLSIAATKQVLSTLDSDETSLAHTFEAAQHALGVGGASSGSAEPGALRRISELATAHGWKTTVENPGFDVAARALDAFSTIGFAPSDEFLDAYASAATTIARADLRALTTRDRPELVAELMVVGTVLGDALIAGLRRLAQENETAELFPVHTTIHDEKDAK